MIAVTSRSGFRVVFEHVDEEIYAFKGGKDETYELGATLEIEPIIVEAGGVIDLNAVVDCYQPRTASTPPGNPIVGRYLKTGIPAEQTAAIHLTIAVGSAAAIPCGEFKDRPSTAMPDLKHWTPTDDIFVVFEPVM